MAVTTTITAFGDVISHSLAGKCKGFRQLLPPFA
jgi:hypothetical protein